MRTAIIGLKKENVAQTAEDVCKLTHFDPRCVGSCVIVSEIINHLIWHDEQLSYSQIITIGNKYDKSIAEYIDKAYYNGIESLELDEPSSIGYTLKALGSALWCLFHANDFEEGLLRVVNEGGDADTNAADNASNDHKHRVRECDAPCHHPPPPPPLPPWPWQPWP